MRPLKRPGASARAALEEAAAQLRDEADSLAFGAHAAFVYNPLDYAWEGHRQYLALCSRAVGGILFLGMNPGPFGMVQTGVPFGEVAAVRDWMGLHFPVRAPARWHPKRPVLGLECPRSEVSGRRLWGLFSSCFPQAPDFFQGHAVMNYCPLAFVTATGANLTPEKLPTEEKTPLFRICDRHLRHVIEILQPRALVGIGAFAAARLRSLGFSAVEILHPSPASPAANRDWACRVTSQLAAAGIPLPSILPTCH